MQKSPAVQAGEKLFQRFFAWCSSVGSHMGQQTNATGYLLRLFRHGAKPLLQIILIVIPWQRAFVDRFYGFSMKM
jgi:hypothetical protein